jgi:hypothetical protein
MTSLWRTLSVPLLQSEGALDVVDRDAVNHKAVSCPGADRGTYKLGRGVGGAIVYGSQQTGVAFIEEF